MYKLYYILTSICLCGLLAAMLVASPSAADTESRTALVLEVSPRQTQVMLGEPILLDYSIALSSEGERIKVFAGEDTPDWLTVSLLDEHGNKIKTRPCVVKTSDLSGGLVSPVPVLEAQKNKLSGSFVVTSQVRPPRPGKYRLLVTGHVRYIPSADPPDALTVKPRAPAEFTREWSFNLEVTSPNVSELHKLSDKLAGTISAAKSSRDERRLAVRMLFSIPEEFSLHSWRSLAVDPKLASGDAALVIDELLCMGTLTAADILAMMWKDQGRSVAMTALLNLWWFGDAEIKTHIERVFASAG